VLGFVGAVQAIAGAQFDRIINTLAGSTTGCVQTIKTRSGCRACLCLTARGDDPGSGK